MEMWKYLVGRGEEASVRDMYLHLQDDVSRFLFARRVLWSLTGDQVYIDEIIDSLCDRGMMDAMVEQMLSVAGRLVIRGAGNEYWTMKRLYPDLEYVCLVDNDPAKQSVGEMDGHPVISPETFYRDYADYYVAVNSSACNREIVEELQKNGVADDHVFNLGDCYSAVCGRQYFEKDIVAPVEHEVFIDGGAYDGATSRRFADWCGGNYSKIYAFEPDIRNVTLLKASMKRKPVERMEIVERGLWDSGTTVGFDASGTQGSKVLEARDATTIKTATIDETVGDEGVTFIKLDIEGAECRAIKGAEETIRRFRPRMAISIYHRPEDIFTLPELIRSIRKDYRFYLRHYQMSRCETILYAV